MIEACQVVVGVAVALAFVLCLWLAVREIRRLYNEYMHDF